MAVAIRTAGPSDCGPMTALAHASKRHWGYDDELIDLWRADLTITPADLVSDVVYCAEIDGHLVGFYSISCEIGAWQTEHMWVLPAHIGTGVGRALFDHMVEQLRARGARTLRIESDPNAAGFYERMGARRVGEVPAQPLGRTLPLFELEIRPQ